jgi:hypothetical protein
MRSQGLVISIMSSELVDLLRVRYLLFRSGRWHGPCHSEGQPRPEELVRNPKCFIADQGDPAWFT